MGISFIPSCVLLVNIADMSKSLHGSSYTHVDISVGNMPRTGDNWTYLHRGFHIFNFHRLC